MKNNHIIGCVCGMLLILSPATSSNAQNIVVNGSFENYGGPGNSNIGAGLPGWTIGNAGGIDIVFSTGVVPEYWQAAQGNVSLSLSYFGPDSVTQSIATTPGQTYHLKFSMAAEIYGGPTTRTMDVIWNNSVIASPSFQYTGQGPQNMGWVEFGYDVTATGNDTLSFLGTTQGPYGPTLDNVSLIQVPEPTSITMCALGLVSLGLAKRRLLRA